MITQKIMLICFVFLTGISLYSFIKEETNIFNPKRYKYEEIYSNSNFLKLNLKKSIGVYVNMYNHKYFNELVILKRLVNDILKISYTKLFYDYNSTEFSVCIILRDVDSLLENKINIKNKCAIVQREIILDYKEIGDLMYSDTNFDNILNLLFNCFSEIDSSFTFPHNPSDIKSTSHYENELVISRNKYLLNKSILDNTKSSSSNLICLSEEFKKFNNNICLLIDNNSMHSISFEFNLFYKIILNKIIWLNKKIINNISNLKIANMNLSNCYKIYIRVKPKDALHFLNHEIIVAHNEFVLQNQNEYNQKIKDMIIEVKHKLLHILGLVHTYTFTSVMNNYENEFQTNNLFSYSKNDYQLLNSCYGDNNKSVLALTENQIFNEREFDNFVYDFKSFMKDFFLNK